MPADLSQIQFGPKMAACLPRERQFVWFYCLNGGKGAQAARDAGVPDKGGEGSKQEAYRLLHRQRVLDAIEEVARAQFRSLIVPAMAVMRSIMENDKHPDQVKTAATVLDRLGISTKTQVDVNVTGQVTLNHTDAALEDLRILKAMGVAQEKLVETFGYSGLARFEKMLAEADAKRPKLIEGEVTERG